MSGLDCLGADEVGFDYMDLVKGAGGLLSASGSGGKDDKEKAAKEKQKLEDEKKAAEKSATTMKLVLIFGGMVLGVSGLAFLVGKIRG